MNVFDGKKRAEALADELKKEITDRNLELSLTVIQAGEDPVIHSFVRQKQKFAQKIGVDFELFSFPDDVSDSDLRGKLEMLAEAQTCHGIIIQLPLPSHLPTQEILDIVPPEKDVDVLSMKSLQRFAQGDFSVLPPVVGAVREIFASNGIQLKGKRVTLIGRGRLVGMPLAIWLKAHHIELIELNSTSDIPSGVRDADIIISGAGEPGLIRGDMIKEGAVVIDAGTSEAGGKIKGDVDTESVKTKASLLSPVPGGVGPLTVAMIFRNLITLATHYGTT